MKNIVATIQREQNRIIRNEEARTLIIQGVAGSGKTSIALHRIAYLLYAFQSKIYSKDILIISPNKVFADYISNVLPELGEETVPETSMEQVLSEVLNHKYKYLSFFKQVNELLTKPISDFIKRIEYKSSFDFIASLDRFFDVLDDPLVPWLDGDQIRSRRADVGHLVDRRWRTVVFHSDAVQQGHICLTGADMHEVFAILVDGFLHAFF